MKSERRAMTQLRTGAALALSCLVSAAAAAADVALLKSSDAVAWRPTLDAIRRVAAGHALTEHDLRGDKAEAARVVGTLKGKSVILVALGPGRTGRAGDGARSCRSCSAWSQDPAAAGLVGAPNTAGVPSASQSRTSSRPSAGQPRWRGSA